MKVFAADDQCVGGGKPMTDVPLLGISVIATKPVRELCIFSVRTGRDYLVGVEVARVWIATVP
jgi:hypothetical protein